MDPDTRVAMQGLRPGTYVRIKFSGGWGSRYSASVRHTFFFWWVQGGAGPYLPSKPWLTGR